MSRAGVKMGRREDGDFGSEDGAGVEDVVVAAAVVIGFGLLGSFVLVFAGLYFCLDPESRFILDVCLWVWWYDW